MFGWFTEKPRKTAIRTVRIYDGIQLKPHIVAAPPELTEKAIEDILDNKDRYIAQHQKDEELEHPPEMKTSRLDPPEKLKEHDVDVVFEVTYTYTPKRIQPKHRQAKFIAFMLAWSFLGFIGLMFWFAEQSRQTRIDSQCYYYMKNGTPSAITIQGTEYKLDADGGMNKVDRTFLNPYHEEQLRSLKDGDCTIINVKGD